MSLNSLSEATRPAGPRAGQAGAAQLLIFDEGRRFVGLRLLRLAQNADPAHVARLLQTKEDNDDI